LCNPCSSSSYPHDLRRITATAIRSYDDLYFHPLQGHIWTRPRCQGALEWTNTLRDRCRHISGLLVKTSHGLRALMKSALPRLITTAASGALSLHRLRGSWSDRSCHQLDYTSHGAARLLHIPVK